MMNRVAKLLCVAASVLLAVLPVGASKITRHTYGEPCRRPPLEHDELLKAKIGDDILVDSNYDVGYGTSDGCVYLVTRRITGEVGTRSWDHGRTYVYEAQTGGWKVTERAGHIYHDGFPVFEPNNPIPLLWTPSPQGAWFIGGHVQRWNPHAKSFEPAQAQDPKALKRYLGLTVVMAQIHFPAGIHGKRSAWERGDPLPHPYPLTAEIGKHGAVESLANLFGEPFLADISKPMGEFNPENASDAALALALKRVDERFREYDRAIFSRRKGGPIIGAIGGPSLNAFSDQALQNSIRIARELTRRYPQVADGWWVLAKLAEWAIHKRKRGGPLLGDPTGGLMRDPSAEGMRALEKLFELRGWSGKSQYAAALPFDPDGRFKTEREYWDHRRTHELYARLRDKKIDREALGKHFGTRPSATDGLAFASPELSSFRP